MPNQHTVNKGPSGSLWTEIAIEAGLDPESARKAYYGFLKVLGKRLKEERVVKFPDLGKFWLYQAKGRRSRDVHSGQVIYITPRTILTFDPDYKLKGYFRDFKL